MSDEHPDLSLSVPTTAANDVDVDVVNGSASAGVLGLEASEDDSFA